MIARAHHPDLAVADLALPVLFRDNLPFWVGAVGLAAIFSAEISAADALLFMLATSLSQDVYKRFVNPAATDAQLLWCARLGAVAGAVLAIAVALGLAKDVVAALGFFYTLLGVSLFVPVVAGIVTRRGGPLAALCGIAGGVAIAAGVFLANNYDDGFYHGLTASMWGLLAAGIAYSAVAALIPATSRLH
jgi:SSS family solute:Na+ symporter